MVARSAWPVYRFGGGDARGFARQSAGAAPPQGVQMQVVERSALVTFTVAQMFALVNDIARYPEFLPWCVGARVEDVSATERIATLKVARSVLQTEFTTRNTLLPDAEIHMQLMHGPFRDLTGEWRFEAIGTRGSRVHFRVEFEFKNRLTATAFNAIFEALCGTIIDAFVLRAQTIYPS
jgi:ribosome-associated toxin RatA of RatAB toxin-antitoxin module